VFASSPVSEYVVLEFVVVDIVTKIPVQEFSRRILYPLIGVPPLLLGTVQLRLICDEEITMADKLLGAEGTENVVAVDSFDELPIPAELIAETR
jgi:hypothetical protein